MNDISTPSPDTPAGDEELPALFAEVYAELKRMARRQSAGHAAATLSTTGLLHEVYLKLERSSNVRIQSRAHFFSLAATAMRQIAIDHARARAAFKRGGEAHAVELDELLAGDAPDPAALLQLDAALSDLQTREPQLAELVELHYFAGLSMTEIADVRAISERTLSRQWQRAKAYLYDALNGIGPV